MNLDHYQFKCEKGAPSLIVPKGLLRRCCRRQLRPHTNCTASRLCLWCNTQCLCTLCLSLGGGGWASSLLASRLRCNVVRGRLIGARLPILSNVNNQVRDSLSRCCWLLLRSCSVGGCGGRAKDFVSFFEVIICNLRWLCDRTRIYYMGCMAQLGPHKL